MDAMNEMVNEVVQKAGIAEHQAVKAVQAVMDYMMARIPEPLSGQVKSHIMGGMGEREEDLGMHEMSKGMDRGAIVKGMDAQIESLAETGTREEDLGAREQGKQD